jgi:hypothetical protein
MVFDGDIIIMREVGVPYEWMPDHDFIPFAPNCGRVYGGKFGREILPYYTHDGMSYSIPYILPFGDPANWASIPQKNVVEFSEFCLRAARHMFREIENLNKRDITVKDLIGSTPRISMPMSKGSTQLPNTNMSITDFLTEVLQEF